MKKYLLFLVLLSSCRPYCEFKARKSKETSAYPPGTVRLNTNVFIDQSEISNLNWREYYFWTLRFDSTNIDKVKPDTTVLKYTWLQEAYFTHPALNDYPVIGITYEQAVAFCKWRTDRVHEYLAQKPNKHFKKVLYRLPTEKEWERAASDLLDPERFPFGLKSVRSYGGNLLINCSNVRDDGSTSFIELVTTKSYCPNWLGLFHTAGNVSEMIDTKGIAKGGNFQLPLDSCRVSLAHRYTKPEAWLGFRAVCEVLE